MLSTLNKRPFRTILCVALLVWFSASAVLYSRWHMRRRSSDAVAIGILREAYSDVLQNYVEKPDSKKLVIKMVDGMLASLDPHSAYLPPEPYHEMEVQISGSFGGVGIELGTIDGKLTVISPIDDSPAFRAGIQANDRILKIDGTSTEGMNISAAVKRMRGDKGTRVNLTIARSDNVNPLAFTIIRDIIKLKSVKPKLLDSGYGFIRISQFQERTGSEFKEALQGLKSKSGGSLKGLILDLRFNPGGLINSCVEVANCFIGDDINSSMIVSTKGRAPGASHNYYATLGTKEERYPMIVLINGGSASASEIVAGALQDHRRAIIMGTQSFGKGSVQSILPMKGDAALKLTTGRYYTPSGRSIQAKGIVPDIEVPNLALLQPKAKGKGIAEKDLDNRLAADGKQDSPPVTRQVSPHGSLAKDVDLQKDYQLNRAVELLQSIDAVKERGFK
jgi:carboxyl-terminal processing protease